MGKRLTLKQRIKQREEEIFQRVLEDLRIETPQKRQRIGSTFNSNTSFLMFTGIESKLIDLATDLREQGKIEQFKRVIKALKDKYKTNVTLLGGEKIR
jgi:hypothetical protein